jgi:peptidoglycan/LPS O-acetylase OafA/YrhL
MSRQKLQSIQILRGIAAILVVLSHFCTVMRQYHPMQSFISGAGLVALGGMGVDIFFVISGFIMVVTTNGRSDGPGAALNFLRKRALRIYPLYWIWTTVLLLLSVLKLANQSHNLSVSYIASSYALWPALNDRGTWHPLMDPGWSLSFELYFYLFFAASIAFRARRFTAPMLFVIFLSLYFIAQALQLVPALTYLFSSPLVFEFLFGVLAGYIYIAAASKVATGNYTKIAVSMIVLSILGFAVALFSAELPILLTHGVSAFFLVLGASLMANSDHRFLSVPVFLGDASYSIYLAHSFFIGIAGNFLKKGIGAKIQPDLLIILGTIVTVVICAQTYRLVELPLISLFAGKRKQLPTAASTQTAET